MSRSPGLMGAVMSEREFTGMGCLASEDQRCDCCDIPLVSPGGGAVSLQSIIMDIMTSAQCSAPGYKGS